MKKLKFTLLILSLIAGFSADSKSIKFYYDQAGNRVKREIVISRSVKSINDGEEDEKSYYDAIDQHNIQISHNSYRVVKVNISTSALRQRKGLFAIQYGRK